MAVSLLLTYRDILPKAAARQIRFELKLFLFIVCLFFKSCKRNQGQICQ